MRSNKKTQVKAITKNLTGKDYTFIKSYLSTIFQQKIKDSSLYLHRDQESWEVMSFDLFIRFSKNNTIYDFLLSLDENNSPFYLEIVRLVVDNVDSRKIQEGCQFK